MKEDRPLDQDLLIARLNMIAADIRHEDNLIGMRMSWLVISQSFLFGTFVTLVRERTVVGAATGAVRLLLILIPLVAVGAASYAISQWRAERDRICEMPEAKQLGWPRLKKRKMVSLLGQLLPIAVSVGFLLVILITMETV